MEDPNYPALHISGYQFVPIAKERLPGLKAQALEAGERQGICGTIILATEGTNFYFAGEPAAAERFYNWFANLPPFETPLRARRTPSTGRPYQRFKVQVRAEIVTMGRPDLDIVQRAPSITPEELKAWLESDQPPQLLDVRNRHEFARGTFEKAEHLDIGCFREFPEVAERLSKFKAPVVTFCTGGIRCEKANIWLRHLGHEETYQLDGGILNYFETVGGAHFQGECFVFDDRVALDQTLRPIETDE